MVPDSSPSPTSPQVPSPESGPGPEPERHGEPERHDEPERQGEPRERASAPEHELEPDQPARAWTPDEPAFEAAVLRAFIKDGRLASIPARERKKLVVYRYLLDRVFPEPDEAVQERDVNMRLALWHPDVATLRRAFVAFGLVRREGMVYRRAVPLRPGGD